LAAFSKLLSCRHGGVTGVLLLLRVHGPCCSLRSSHLSWVCRPYLFYSLYAISSTTLCLLRYFLRTATVMGRKQPGNELNARVKANGYKRGAHWEEGTCSLPREPLLPPPARFRDGLEEVPETPYRGLLVHFTYSAIRSCTKRAVPKIGNVQRILSGIDSRSGTTLAMESCTGTTGTSN
jgi:hypothetical protein